MSSKNKGLTKLINKLGLTKQAMILPSHTSTGAPGTSVGTQGWRQEQQQRENNQERVPADPQRVVANGYRMVVDKENGFIYFIRTKPDINAETYKMESRLVQEHLSQNEEYNSLNLSDPQQRQRALAIRRQVYAQVKEEVKTPEMQQAIRTNAEAAVGKPLTYQDVNADKSDRGLAFDDETLSPIRDYYNSLDKPLHRTHRSLGADDIPVMVSDESLNGMLRQTSSDAKLTPEMISLQLLNNGRARQIALDMQSLDPYIDSDVYWGWDEDVTKLNTFRKDEARNHFKALPQQYLDAILTSTTLPAEQKAAILQGIGYDENDTSTALQNIEDHLRAKAELAYQQSRAFEYAFRDANGNYNLEGNAAGSKGLFNGASTGEQIVMPGIGELVEHINSGSKDPIPPKATANIALAMAHSQVAPGAMQWYRTNFNRDNLMQSDFAEELQNSTLGKTVNFANEMGQWGLNRIADTGYNGYKYVTDWDNHTWKSDVARDSLTPWLDPLKPTNLGVMAGDVLTGGTVAQMLQGIEAQGVRDMTIPSLLGTNDLPLSDNDNLRRLTPQTAQDAMTLKTIYAPGREWHDDGQVDTVLGAVGTALIPFGAASKPATTAAGTAGRSLLGSAARGAANHVVQPWVHGVNIRNWRSLYRAPFVLTDPLSLQPRSVANISQQVLAGQRAQMPNLTGEYYDKKFNLTGSAFRQPFEDYHDITGVRNKVLAQKNAQHLAQVEAAQESERAAANHTQYRPIDSNKPTTSIKSTTNPSAKSTTQNSDSFSQYAPWALAGVGALGLGALALSSTNRKRQRQEEEEEYRRRYLYSMSPRYRKKYMY